MAARPQPHTVTLVHSTRATIGKSVVQQQIVGDKVRLHVGPRVMAIRGYFMIIRYMTSTITSSLCMTYY